MSELNPAQREAVEHGDGPLLMAASPGAGKTKTLTMRVAKLLERDVPAHRILLLTFTNRAANEMRERVEKQVGAAAKRVVAGTFHSVCVRILRAFESDELREGRKKDFSIYDGDDSEGCVKMAISELELDKKEFKASEFREKISFAKAHALTWHDMPEDDDLAIIGKRVWQRYEEILKHNNAFDFDDLLNVIMRRAEADDECGKALRQRYTHVLVDEYQDTSHVQFRLVKALGASRNLSVVGDQFQSVYSFRAADPRNIRDFAKEFPDAKVVTLAQNYRSTKNIVATFNSLVDGGYAVTDNPAGDRTLIRSFGDDAAEARFVVAGILNKIANGTPPGEIAVLYRVHALSRAIEEELRRQGQRYQVVGGMGFYERKVVKDSMAYLRLISNPDSDLDFERVINEPSRGLGEKAVAKIRERARNAGKSLSAGVEDALASGLITGKAYEGLQRFYYVMKQVREVAEGNGPGRLAAAANHLLTASGYRLSLETKLNRYKKERKAAEAEKIVQDQYNLEQVVAAVDAYEKRVEKATLQGYLEEVSLISAQDDLGGSKISLITGHACVHPDTLVETAEGLLPIKDIAATGRIATAVGARRYKNKVAYDDCKLITLRTKYGYELTVTNNHRLMVWDGSNYAIKRVSDIKLQEFVRLKIGASVDPKKAAELPRFPEVDVRAYVYRVPARVSLEVAEFFGLMVADGTVFKKGFRLVKRHKDVRDRFAKLCKKLFGCKVKQWKDGARWCAEVLSHGLSDWLIEIGGMAPRRKDVPECILRSNRKVQAAFLRGLFEDGTVNRRANGHVDHASWLTAYEPLSKKVHALLLRQGIIATRFLTQGYWRIDIYGQQTITFAKKIGFVSKWKRGRLDGHVGKETRSLVPVDPNWVRKNVAITPTNIYDVHNAIARKHVSRNVAKKWGMHAELMFHHDRIVEVTRSKGPAMCVEVPGVGRFLQNGIDGENSKGLEYDAVWVVGFEKGMLPFAMAATEAEREEEGRLAYVMCSRPRKWLTISYCDERFYQGRVVPTGQSEFLDRIPVECSIWRERDEKMEALKGRK